MKYLPWVLAGLLAVALAWVLMAGPGREAVGVVNLMRVVDESPRAQELNQMLADRYQELLTRFDLEDEPTEEDVDRSARERQAYAEYLAYRQELELQLEGEVNAAVKEVAESRGISVVLDSDVIRYGGTDLTDEVIRKLK
ncbi:MAG: OmpH family outer membrane protein [Limnochordia bacterium]|nr:OmpH family outer membrane protein [Bacillota bacterium]NLL07548.1 OmpH family outer membrane protein [Bacillota bacterium]HBG09627.1 hypothetical protein [Bacillota bacterium]